jgi:hypothetical protein
MRGKAHNSGSIDLAGGPKSALVGPSLVDSGVLTNNGGITVNSGYPTASYSALLEVTGTLINDLDVSVQGYGAAGGGTLSVSGTLQNNF